MNFVVTDSGATPIRPGDLHFTFNNGLIVSNRASFEISNNCPTEYRSILITAINAGWIKPIAYVTKEEYMVMQLSN